MPEKLIKNKSSEAGFSLERELKKLGQKSIDNIFKFWLKYNWKIIAAALLVPPAYLADVWLLGGISAFIYDEAVALKHIFKLSAVPKMNSAYWYFTHPLSVSIAWLTKSDAELSLPAVRSIWRWLNVLGFGYLGVFWLTKAVRKRKSAQKKGCIHGQQRFAKKKDLQKAELLLDANSPDGMIFGMLEGELAGASPQLDWHSIVFGGQGTGKTSNCIIPTLLSFSGSALVLDIKGELFDITAGYRQTLGKVIRFCPGRPETWSYDPLAKCDQTIDGITECEEFARQLLPLPDKCGENGWITEGAQGLVSSLAYIIARKGGSITELAKVLNTKNHIEIAEYIESTSDQVPIIMAQSFMVSNEKSRGFYISEAANRLRSFALDNTLISATDPNGRVWNAEMLEENCTIYLQISEDKLIQYKDLWRLIFMQVLRHLRGRGERKQPPILVELDEFPQFGRINELPEMLAMLRSRNVHMLLSGQSVADVDSKYDELTRRRIVDNCTYTLILGAADPVSQKYFSDMIGQQTEWQHSQGQGNSSRPNQLFGSESITTTDSKSETGVPLVRPEDIRNLGYELIMIPRNTWPAKLKKAYYKSFPAFRARNSMTIVADEPLPKGVGGQEPPKKIRVANGELMMKKKKGGGQDTVPVRWLLKTEEGAREKEEDITCVRPLSQTTEDDPERISEIIPGTCEEESEPDESEVLTEDTSLW